MEADIMRQKEAAEVAKREHELELARLRQGNVDDRPRYREDLYGCANDPRTANDPQIGPQMIPDRK